MAYQTGTALDPADLLDKLRVFAAANGWTINNYGDRTAGTAPRKALQITKAGMAGSFLSDSANAATYDPGPYILTYAHDAYVAGNGTENQANGNTKTKSNGLAGPYQAYHFFTDNGDTPPYLYVVVETGSGTFKHFGIGKLESMGALNTGAFAHGCNWNYSTSSNPPYVSQADYSGHAVPFDCVTSSGYNNVGTAVRADSDGIAPHWFYDYNSTTNLQLSGGVRGTSDPTTASSPIPMLYGIMTTGASSRTGRTILEPCLVAGARPSGQFSLLGWPPNIRWVDLKYLDPGATLTLGTDTWKVFPVIRKNGTNGQPNSARYGYAYKVN